MQTLIGSLNQVARPPPQIGFDFNPLDTAWDKSLEELRLVAEANGGVAHVPQRDPERPELGLWCMTQARSEPPPHDNLS